jgi:PAS domain S-box-containing protein
LTLRAGALAVGFWLSMAVSVQFTRQTGQLASLWFANALVLSVLLRRPEREWPYLLGAALLPYAAMSLQAFPLRAALVMPLGNTVEILVCAAGLRRLFKDDLDLSRPRHLMSFAAFALTAPLGFSLSAFVCLALIGKAGSVADIVSGYAAHALGLLILTPVLLTIKTSDFRALIEARTLRRAGWLVLVFLSVLFSVFAQTRYPFLFFVPGVLILITFNGSTTAAAAALLVTSLVSICATLMGYGPISLMHGPLREKLFVLQVFLLVMTASILPVSAALAGRRRLEARLRRALKDSGASEARYRLLTENANDIVTEMDRSGRFTYASPSFAMTGYSAQEAIGRRALDFMHPDDRDRVAAAFFKAMKGASTWRIEYRVICKDGRILWVEARPSLTKDPVTGEPLSVTDVIRDITERKTAEEALKASERRFRSLVNGVTDYAIYMLDPEGHVVNWNAGAERVKGYTAEEIIGHSFSRFYTPEDQAADGPARALGQARLAGRFAGEGWRVRKDGSRFWADVVIEPIQEDGELVGFTKITRDITDRMAAAAAISESEARYRLLADHSTDVILRFGPDGAIQYASPACRQMGYEPDELIGLNTLDITYPEDRDFAAESVRSLFSGEADRRLRREIRVKRKDGGYAWMEGNPSLILGEDGKPIGAISVFRDVTARRELEDSLAAAKAEAEAATAVKSEFLSNMSHELRTPLTSILGFSDLLAARGALEGEDRRYLDRIVDASKGLLTTVNDILDFSKLEAGQVEIELRSIDPVALGKSALELLSPQASAKGLTCLFKEDGLPDRVMADDTRIRQILLNLISNAVKFTPTGSVTLEAAYDEATRRLRYTVIDTGLGVPPDRVSRLFQRFSQVDASTTRAFGGTGLGLAICKGLAEAMGGEVGVQSVDGEGSRFWVEAPAERSDADAGAQTAAAMALDLADVLDGLRVLVVDDNPVNRELTKIILRPFGVIATEAPGGAEAVSLAASEPFDLILMDVRMPDVDGMTAARRIRGSSKLNAASPIIAFTADAGDERLSDAWQGVFDDRLAKPIIASDLIAILATWAPSAGRAAGGQAVPHV